MAPLAHCGSHCCANCITTGSGRDLPSVARNSVSRGLLLGVAQCNSNGNSNSATRNTDVRRRYDDEGDGDDDARHPDAP